MTFFQDQPLLSRERLVRKPLVPVHQLDEFFDTRHLRGRFAIPRLVSFLYTLLPPVQCFEVREPQLGLHGLDIAEWIYAPGHVEHVGILETPDHMQQGVHLPDLREEPVAQPLPLTGAFDEAGNVPHFQGARSALSRLKDLDQLGDTSIRHRGDADVGFDRGVGIVRCQRLGTHQRVEYGGLAHIRETDHSTAEPHALTPEPPRATR